MNAHHERVHDEIQLTPEMKFVIAEAVRASNYDGSDRIAIKDLPHLFADFGQPLSVGECETLVRGVLMSPESDKLSLEEVYSLFEEKLAYTTSRESMVEAFHMIADQGSLTAAEIVSLLTEIGGAKIEGDIREMLRAVPTDDSGHVNIEAFVREFTTL